MAKKPSGGSVKGLEVNYRSPRTPKAKGFGKGGKKGK